MMRRILLVDDEPMILRVMRNALQKEGYKVDTAVDGEDAWARLVENCPDILLTDIEMPRLTGKELCMRIVEKMPDRNFPIFISTSLTALEHREWSNSIPNLIFLEKPISIRKLRTEIARFVESSEPMAVVDVR
jgi:chemosensory pili system protein ChpA (sensor histidine kinase/response regulator)